MASNISGTDAPNTRPPKCVSATLLMPQRLILACNTFTRLAENSLARIAPSLFIRAAICVVFEPGAAATSITRCGALPSANKAATGNIELAS
ncbi:Uncharacterised protein [Shigella flexneri]|nr:Uncharacterised protein [Shigella flexneri]